MTFQTHAGGGGFGGRPGPTLLHLHFVVTGASGHGGEGAAQACCTPSLLGSSSHAQDRYLRRTAETRSAACLVFSVQSLATQVCACSGLFLAIFGYSGPESYLFLMKP